MDYKEKVIDLLNSQELSKEQKRKLESIFPELKESEDERIRKEIICIFKSLGDGKIPTPINYANIFTWLEKQGEQKPTNKVEPKFKVGDWVTNGIDFTFQVRSIEDDMYLRSDEYFIDIETADKTFRLWTIQDAKDGDLLADDYGIYIFDRFDEDDEKSFLCMGAYQYSQKVYENEHMLCSVEVHPATKEQRELLFQKMKEAGYEWNAEKKELKKIEQNPVEWSEEDETHLRDAIYAAENIYTDKCGKEELVDWLKSLRPQKQCALTKLEKSKIWEALNKTYAVDYRDTLYKKIVSRS